MRQSSRPSGRRVSAAVATVLALSLMASACGGTKASDKKSEVKLSEKGLTAKAGETVTLAANAGHVHAFDVETGLRLNDKPVVAS